MYKRQINLLCTNGRVRAALALLGVYLCVRAGFPAHPHLGDDVQLMGVHEPERFPRSTGKGSIPPCIEHNTITGELHTSPGASPTLISPSELALLPGQSVPARNVLYNTPPSKGCVYL